MASETPEFMHWSEKPISWSRADHPEVMPSPGSYALVLDATFATDRQAARFSRVLIDGGSSINIMYKDTMEKLGIKQRQLQNSRTVFHGIVPGLSCSPIGKILLDFTVDAVDAVCITLPFVLKYQDFGPPRDELGDCRFCYLYDKNYAFEYTTLCYVAWHRARLVGPGTRCLAL